MRQLKKSIVILLILLTSGVATGEAPSQDMLRDDPPRRIICMAPALTEICFALGWGDAIVGVTEFCQYPEQATALPRVGGFLNPNLERIVALKPDLVLMVPEEAPIRDQLRQLGIRTLILPVYRIEDTIRAFERIAELMGEPDRGELLASEFKNRLEQSGGYGKLNPAPRVLLVVGRDPGGLRNIFVAGPGTFLDELLRLAGGVNSYSGKMIYPDISLEGLLAMDPDVVIEFWAEQKLDKNQKDQLRRDWDRLPTISAVKNRMIFILDDPSLTIPGPRIPDSVMSIRRCLESPRNRTTKKDEL